MYRYSVNITVKNADGDVTVTEEVGDQLAEVVYDAVEQSSTISMRYFVFVMVARWIVACREEKTRKDVQRLVDLCEICSYELQENDDEPAESK